MYTTLMLLITLLSSGLTLAAPLTSHYEPHPKAMSASPGTTLAQHKIEIRGQGIEGYAGERKNVGRQISVSDVFLYVRA